MKMTEKRGASKGAIKAHYDTGNDFYRIWLDDSMTYSCALWEDEGETLEQAQMRKLDHHIREAHAEKAARVLDIGCGWGSGLARLSEISRREKLVGLTLSDAQKAHIDSLGIQDAEVRLESWVDHKPDEPYDAIISIGALEHFVRPEMSNEERIEIYTHFFSRCHEMLRPGGYLSLQTMAYGLGSFVQGALSSIFPESDLPRLGQLAPSFEPYFELRRLRNDPGHYADTVRVWLEKFRARRDEAFAAAGDERANHFEKFLEAGIRGYDARIFHLYRLTLRRLDNAG